MKREIPSFTIAGQFRSLGSQVAFGCGSLIPLPQCRKQKPTRTNLGVFLGQPFLVFQGKRKTVSVLAFLLLGRGGGGGVKGATWK